MATNFIHYHSVVSGSERSDARDKLSPSPPIFRRVAVAGLDLQIRGRRGRSPKIVFRPFGPRFSLKIRGGGPGASLDPPLGGNREGGGARQFSFTFPIRHFRNAKETGAETRPAIDSGIITEDSPVSYWSIFSLSLVIATVPEVFEKVHSANICYQSFNLFL